MDAKDEREIESRKENKIERNRISNREEPQKCSQSPEAFPHPSYHFDDITLFMAWQNWYLVQYSTLFTNFYISQSLWFYGSSQMPQHGTSNQALDGRYSTAGTTRPASNVVSPTPRIPHFRQQMNQQTNQQTEAAAAAGAGVEVTTAPLSKRIGAEFIDFVVLLLLKLLVISAVFGDKYIERFQYILLIDEKTTLEDLQLTLFQAMIFRVLVIAYEGYCLSGTLPGSTGKTVGKALLGLEVISCDAVEDVDIVADRVRVIPGRQLGAWKSMVRATLKNMIISVFFPAIILPFHFMSYHNRLIYDVAAGTIVIKTQRNQRQRGAR